MPRDLVHGVTQEIGDVELRPQFFGGFLRDSIQPQLGFHRILALLQAAFERAHVAAQPAARYPEEILEQLRLPSVPDLGAGAAYVGDRQQVQAHEMALVPHAGRERSDDVRIGQILLLRGGGHHEVVLHQPGHEFRVGSRQAVLATEPARIYLAQRRMVAAASFGDVVEEAREVEQFGSLEIAHQAAAQRKFVREFRHREAPQVAHHVEYVFVHGVDVIQIMLHLAGDAPECRNIAAEDSVLIHAL